MGITRRDFLKGIGKVGVAVGTISLIESCVRKPKVEKIIPYLVTPENIIPGVPYYYNTVCRECFAGCGITVKVLDGFAKKIEGNKLHPINEGKTCPRAQAAVDGLYNPDRIKKPMKRIGRELKEIEYESAEEEFLKLIEKGEEVLFVSHNITGYTLELWKEFLRDYNIPEENFVIYETISFAPLKKASEIVFGISKIPYYDISDADYILSTADFLEVWLSTTHYQRQFGKAHSIDEEKLKMAKFVQIDPRLSLQSMNADEWLKTKPGTEEFVLGAILKVIIDENLYKNKVEVKGLPTPEEAEEVSKIESGVIRRIAREFAGAQKPICLPYSTTANSTQLCVISHLINFAVGAIPERVLFDGFQYNFITHKELLEKIKDKKVIVAINVDILYTFPYVEGKIVAISTIKNKTTQSAELVIPDAHYLEAYGDYEVLPGIYTTQQPVVAPEIKQKEDFIISLIRKKKEFFEDAKTYFEEKWKQKFGDDYIKVLENGGDFKFEKRKIEVSPKPVEMKLTKKERELMMYLPIHLLDGRNSNSPEIQEFFDPSTKTAWCSPLEISEKLAKELNIKEGEIVKVEIKGKIFELPVLITNMEGIAIGMGRGKNVGRFEKKSIGINPLEFLDLEFDESGEILFTQSGIQISKTGRKMKRLPKNEGITKILGRDVAPHIEISKIPEINKEEREKEYKKLIEKKFGKDDPKKWMRDMMKESPYKWEMVIDLSKCIGCSACMIACRIENNIPVVGIDEVIQGREITWIRVERYFLGNLGDKFVFQPMLCQQCSSAPCEYVCPVYATMHSSEGLNVQVYNRCVGTRFCANNCPYKVRYFNWFDYTWEEPLNLRLNPLVSARSKGVMEKCTFCSHRIKEARWKAKIEDREIMDGEIKTACEEVCPTDAITFGNAKDKNSKISKIKEKSKRGDIVLKEMGTEPAILYLEKVFLEMRKREENTDERSKKSKY